MTALLVEFGDNVCKLQNLVQSMFMPPTLKKLEGHIAFGLSVCVSVCLSVCVLTFEW